MIMQEEESAIQTQQEQYDTWKQNSAMLYDRLIVNHLPLPSLTFYWLPEKVQSKHSTVYKYVYSTNSSGEEEEEFVYFAQMEFPTLKTVDQEPITTPPENNVYFKVSHPGQANRIISNPNNPQQIATKTVEGVVNIYQERSQFPIQLLTGHEEEGYGIDWKSQGIVSGAYDGQVLVWKDVYATNTVPTFAGKYTDKIEDTKWIDENAFLAVADDGCATVWDVRQKKQVANYQWHTSELNSLDINPFQKELIVVGTGSGLVKLWDLRSPNDDLFPFDNHTQPVIRVQWSPHSPNVFASASTDTKVNIWDILKVGVEVPSYETQQISSELMFTHKGHRGPVSDMNWNPYQPLLGSVEESFNTLQFYQIPSLLNERQTTDLEFQKTQIFS